MPNVGVKGSPPSRSRALRALLGTQWAKPPDDLEMRPRNHPVYRCTGIQCQKKNSSSLETYKKEKLARCVYINLSKLKLQMNEHVPKRLTRFFSRKFKFTNIVKHSDDLHEIGKRSNKKLKRLPKILLFLLY